MSGVRRKWYLSGQLQEETEVHKGAGNGMHREWYENGAMRLEELIEHGIEVWHKRWDERGALVESRQIKEDSVHYQILQNLRKAEADRPSSNREAC